MTRYLLDRDVMSQLDQPEAKRHINIRRWFKATPDNELHVSAITIMEAWRGFAIARRKATGSPRSIALCDAYEDAFEKLVSTFLGRIVPVDEQVAKLWGQLRGRLDKNHWDLAVAAAAMTHDMVVATRNLADFGGRGARVINPFHKAPAIIDP